MKEFIFGATTCAVVGLTAWGLWRWSDPLTLEEHSQGKALLGVIDASEFEVETLGTAEIVETGWETGEARVRITNPAQRGPFIAACVNAAKAEFGCPVDNQANRMVARKFIRDIMVERGMRPSHIMKFLDDCVEGVFIHSAPEVNARKLRLTRSWVARKAEYRAIECASSWWPGWMFRLPTERAPPRQLD